VSRVEIHIPQPCDEDDLHRLTGWLQEQPSVRRHQAVKRVPAPISEAGMGTADLIVAIIGTGLSAGQLALAIVAWRSTLPTRRRPAVVLSRDDLSVTIESDDAEFVADLVRKLEC
jgi:hypothetical protein